MIEACRSDSHPPNSREDVCFGYGALQTLHDLWGDGGKLEGWDWRKKGATAEVRNPGNLRQIALTFFNGDRQWPSDCDILWLYHVIAGWNQPLQKFLVGVSHHIPSFPINKPISFHPISYMIIYALNIFRYHHDEPTIYIYIPILSHQLVNFHNKRPWISG